MPKPIVYPDGQLAQTGDTVFLPEWGVIATVEEVIQNLPAAAAMGTEGLGIMVTGDRFGRLFISSESFEIEDPTLITRANPHLDT